MAHVFISYSTQNRDYAYKLAKRLRDEGIEVWIDNAEIRSGDDWSQAIFAAIRAASAMIVIMTSAAQESEWVRREVLLANETRKRIFPILLEGEKWDLLLHIQYADVRKTGGLPPKLFFDELRTFLQDQINITVKPPTMPNTSPPTTPSDQITSPHGCLRNATIVAALIGAVAIIAAALITAFAPSLILTATPVNTVAPTPTSTLTATTESPTLSPVNVTTAAPIVGQLTETMIAVPLMTSSPSAPTQVVSTAVQPTSMIAPQGTSINIDVIRGRGLLALTTNDAIDLSGLVIDFGGNERYSLGEILPTSASSSAGQTWCLRQPENAAALDTCTTANTYTTAQTGNNWRNATITFRWQGSVIGECIARPGENASYSCTPLVLDAP